ncbi:hypothetical protein M3Y97_00849600 [Aphelenchoides bicaudatus]|nr:hypothetical protein M3Y97_00849600 [Aphelenchoides bicaudatus]
MRKHLVDDYKKLKEQVFEHLDKNACTEQIVNRRLAINYFDSNNLKQVVTKDAKRVLLTFDPTTGGIIIGLGPFKILPQQFIYGIQPYLHLEYKIKCLVIKVGTIVPLLVTGATKDKMTGEIFGGIHGVVPNFFDGKATIGKTIKVSARGLNAG